MPKPYAKQVSSLIFAKRKELSRRKTELAELAEFYSNQRAKPSAPDGLQSGICDFMVERAQADIKSLDGEMDNLTTTLRDLIIEAYDVNIADVEVDEERISS